MKLKSDSDTHSDSGTAAEGVRQHAIAVKEDLRGLGRATVNAAEDRLVEGKKIALETGGQIEGHIRENPLRSVLIATGAGVLAGFLLSRRRNTREARTRGRT